MQIKEILSSVNNLIWSSNQYLKNFEHIERSQRLGD